MNWNKLTPMRGRLVVKRDEVGEQKEASTGLGVRLKDSLIYIPEESADWQNKRKDQATVMAVGEPRITDAGTSIPVPVKVGEKVLITPYGGTPFEYEDEGRKQRVEVITSEEIIARVNQEDEVDH